MDGYDSKFLGDDLEVPIPWIVRDKFLDVVKGESLRKNYILDYKHYSVVMSRKNRLAYLSICNLDQNTYRSVSGRNWFLDDRIDLKHQIDNRYYKDMNNTRNYWNRGHLTRRTAVTWGDDDFTARKASNDSCCYTNACLQHKYFNEDEWRIPEKVAEKFGRDKDGKLSIITGPLLTDSDRYFDPEYYDSPPARIPAGFWKVIYYVDKKKSEKAGKDVLGCEAYLVYQDELSIRTSDGADTIDTETLQVTISELQDLTGIEFSRELYDANPFWYHASEERGIKSPERYLIKTSKYRNDKCKKGWDGHVIHDREDITKHRFKRVSE